MSINCVNCVVNDRTGTDLLCDECRDSKDEIAKLARTVKRLPAKADVELALLANNGGSGLEFRDDYCQCDPDVGMSPCQYCAIDSVLQRLLTAITQ